MKLPGIDYERPVQSLGRENVSGPVRVAKAQAGVAEKRASVAGQIARDTAAVGRIHQGTGREIAASQRSNISRTQQFSNDLGRLAKSGSALGVSMIKADVARDMSKHNNDMTTMMDGLTEGPLTMQVPIDPNDPTRGTKTVSMANDLLPAFDREMQKMNELAVKNANPFSRSMLAEQLEMKTAAARVEMAQMSVAKQKDFTGGQVLETINELVADGNAGDVTAYGRARAFHNENRNLYGGAKNAQIAKIIDAQEESGKIDNQAFDSADRIIDGNKNYTDRMGAAEKIRNKEVRQGTIAIIQRQQRTIDYAMTKAKQQQVDGNKQHNLNQFNTLPPDEWTVSPNATIAQRNSLEAYRDKKIKGSPVDTDEVLLSTLRKQAYNDWDEFRKVDLQAVRDKLEDKHWEELDKLQVKDPTTTSTTAAYSYSKMETVGNGYLSMVAPGSRTKSKVAEKHNKVKNIVWDQIQHIEKNGGKVTDDAVQKMYRDITREVDNDSWIELDSRESDEFINGVIIDSGNNVSSESVIAERENYTEWATRTQKKLRSLNKPEASPEELQAIYRRNRIK